MKPTVKNVIIISIDALRSDCVAVNPDKKLLEKYKLKTRLKTPILDLFVNRGIFFNNCISSAPYTSAAHASILTGKWPYKHGIIDFFRNRLNSRTVIDILKRKGFSTLWQTDFPFLLGSVLGFTGGVDKFIPGNDEESFVWLEKNKSKPLACFFHFINVHDPYGFANLYYGGDDYRSKVGALLKKYDIKSDTKAKRNNHYPIRDFSEEEMVLKQNYQKILMKMHRLKLYDEIMDLYIGGINYFEKTRFKIFYNKLKELGLLENSLVAVIGDHGEAWDESNQGHARGNSKDSLIDDIIKVPLIFYSPDISQGILINKQVRTIDIAPTVLSFLGYKKEAALLDGHDLSFVGAIPDDLPAFSQFWYAASGYIGKFMDKAKEKGRLPVPDFDSYLAVSAIRQKGFKLVQNFSKNKKMEETQLFNVWTGEERIKNKEAVRDELEDLLNQYNIKTWGKINKNARVAEVDSRGIARQLRTLGYNV